MWVGQRDLPYYNLRRSLKVAQHKLYLFVLLYSFTLGSFFSFASYLASFFSPYALQSWYLECMLKITHNTKGDKLIPFMT